MLFVTLCCIGQFRNVFELNWVIYVLQTVPKFCSFVIGSLKL